MTAFPLRRLTTVTAGLVCLTMASCNSTKKPGYDKVVDYTTPDTGLSQEEYPFDEKGNYLADVVSGKKKGSKNKKGAKPVEDTTLYDTPPEPTVAATSSPNYETPPASDPYAPVYSSGSTTSNVYKPEIKTYQPSSSSSSSSKPKSTASTKSKPKPKPAPKTVAKAKPKPKAAPKPSATSYTVKKGDTLYSLANRYGTSVAAIKKASGLSSDTLRDGKTIKIPKK